ncbi:MAG TPA: NupC/NupG family nucleoside CNT transporter [Firmicutes bacterium]|nr:NupC/NupG family nucleoside CNT transporter [Bacillota bacterium]
MNILFGILSLIVLVGIAYLFSENKKAVKFQTIIAGILMQVVLIFFVIKIPIGQTILETLSNFVNHIIQLGMEGVEFVFGGISDNYVFGINVLALIIFTSALISVLYYLRIIPFLIKYIGRSISFLMGTTGAETFSAVANSFLGGTEAPLVIKPFLAKLTRSELFAVMAAGFGSASAAILAGYAMMGIDMKYLLIAVFTVPFSCLMIAKVLIPETEESQTKEIELNRAESESIFEAISEGTANGLSLALNVGAMLIAFIGLIALVNAFLGLFGTSISTLLGYVFYPFGFLFNIPSNEIFTFASLVGSKFAINEFFAYSELVQYLDTLSPRTIGILSVVLCNFANISTIGIQIGGFSSFAPSRKKEVTKLGMRALFAGTIATLTTGAIVGMFL